jgi:hypothetical protein
MDDGLVSGPAREQADDGQQQRLGKQDDVSSSARRGS